MAPDGSVQCLRCGDVISNPKVVKLHNHLTRCNGYTLVEKKQMQRLDQERAEEKAHICYEEDWSSDDDDSIAGSSSEDDGDSEELLDNENIDTPQGFNNLLDHSVEYVNLHLFKAMVDELMEEPFVGIPLDGYEEDWSSDDDDSIAGSSSEDDGDSEDQLDNENSNTPQGFNNLLDHSFEYVNLHL
ncbi:hypothetical protein PHMEG_00024094 [Phytophthora megakarya]|uniref:Uncharacterized protein n=1 Tax=Phytophthora megakarya TaxID=4795 RepID=A0A225VFJ0_9STRA|nr:hypothetical protein PHMEG_00024094 [Phytophthora megakarya]